MATVRKRNGKWQARVRRVGHPGRARSFATKPEAQRWIRDVEAELDAAEAQPLAGARASAKLLASTTVLADIADRRRLAVPRRRAHLPLGSRQPICSRRLPEAARPHGGEAVDEPDSLLRR